jgi:AraC family transcriptional regulator of arabinose operon
MLPILFRRRPVRHGPNDVDLSQTTAADLLHSPPRVVLANFYPFRPGETNGPHASASVLLLTASSGRGAVEFPARNVELTPSRVLVLPWMMPRRYIADRAEPFRVIGVHLAPTGEQPLHLTGVGLRPPTATGHLQSVPDPDLTLRATMEAAVRAFAEPPGPFRDAALAGWGLALAARIAGGLHAHVDRIRHAPAPALAALESWMRLSLGRSISRSELARRAGLSPSHLAAAFKRAYGLAPLAYLQELRLIEARRLLQSGDDSVAGIAAQVGFSDPFWFSRVFHRRWGAPPRAMRRL